MFLVWTETRLFAYDWSELREGIPVILAAAAASAALRAVNARRVAIVHPPWFSEGTNDKGKVYFRARGLPFCPPRGFSLYAEFQEVPPAEVHRWVATAVPKEADAVLIAGNGLRAIGVN